MDFICPQFAAFTTYKPAGRHLSSQIIVIAIVVAIDIAVVIMAVRSSPSDVSLLKRGCRHVAGVELSLSLGLLTNYDKSVIK